MGDAKVVVTNTKPRRKDVKQYIGGRVGMAADRLLEIRHKPTNNTKKQYIIFSSQETSLRMWRLRKLQAFLCSWNACPILEAQKFLSRVLYAILELIVEISGLL